ncbi:MAG: hypothetical protein WDO16_21905 [Bacteroidota bacterium]
MKQVLFLIYLASILSSVLTAFIYRKHLESRKLLILLPFLFLVFIQEVLLGFFILFSEKSQNAIIYNIYQPVTIIIFAFIYYKVPFMAPVRKLIIAVTIIYLLVLLVNYSFFQSIKTTDSYLRLVRGFIVTFWALLFLSRYFHLDNLSDEKYWRPLLWVTIGIAIFYPVISISLSFQKYLTDDASTFYGFKLYHLIPRVMSIFMYSCFSYAFYLCHKKN